MSEQRRWSMIPQSRALCLLWLLVGAALVTRVVIKLVSADGNIGAFDIISIVCAGIVVVCSAIGLASPRLRGQ